MTDYEYLRGRTVLLTGAAGTVGRAIAEMTAPHVKALRCFDHAESELFFLHEYLKDRGAVAPQLGDIRDLDRLRFAMNGVDVVIHTAALKHVGLGEYNPFEVVQSNLQGLNNVIRAALDANVDRVIFTSSDKAVNPTNVMGASKMMGERLITAANEIRGHRQTRFSSVRFGNVIGSRGSVVPIFAKQLRSGQSLTLTDEGMTRYVMTVRQAAELVLEAGYRMLGGEVFVTKMPALRIIDLAHTMADILTGGRISFRRVGARAGEKLYEELLSLDELPRSLELERLLVVLPPSQQLSQGPDRAAYAEGRPVTKEWNSSKDTFMTRAEILAFLREHEVLAQCEAEGQV